MASTQALSAAAQDRKTRLAQLKSLKRKQRDDEGKDAPNVAAEPEVQDGNTTSSANINGLTNDNGEIGDTTTSRYISGRNYDVNTKNAKLGFEQAPNEGQETLEHRAAALAAETAKQAESAAQEDKPLDLFALQPRRPNWDLKRDLEQKLNILNVRTDNAIARLVRERIAAQQKAAKANGTVGGGADGDGSGVDAFGLEGAALVEATNVREREDEEEARRDREEEAALLDAS